MAIVLEPRPYRNSYEAAIRHSRMVSFLKFFIPFGTIVLIAGLILKIWLDSFYYSDDYSVGDISISGTQVTMEAPKLTGYSNKAQPYRVSAAIAVQDLKDMNIVYLQKLDGLFKTDSNQSEIRIQADKGVYNTQNEYLEVEENIVVTSHDGQQLFMSSAAIDMEAGTVRSVDPVHVVLPDGTIDAKALEIFDNGDLISFRKDVEAVFYKITEPDSGQDKDLSKQNADEATPLDEMRDTN